MQPIPIHAQQAVLLSMSLQNKQQVQPQPQIVPILQSQVAPPPEINTYKACTLEPNQHYAVYVSFVNDGPTHFSVQLQQSEQTLVKLMKDINGIDLRMIEDVPLPGAICLARCLEDNNVCRAVVTNEVDNQFKVFYVDFGNSEILPLEALYQIPFKYVLPKVMAIRLALNGVDKSTVTMEMKLAFKKFVDNRLLYMKVLPSAQKAAIPKCELWDPETKTNALDVINRAAQHAYPEPLLLSRGFTQAVKVSYVYSCNRFYVQLLAKDQELAKLMNDLQISCPSSDPVYDVKLGLPCCALFEADQLWYRGQVVDVLSKDKVKVRYIDYGNEEEIPVVHLRTVEGELLTVLRPQAIECCLTGYQNMEPEDSRDALLEQLILEQNFTMRVNEMFGQKALVDLIDGNNYNVASLLLDKLAALKSAASPVLVQAGNTLQHRKSSGEQTQYKKTPREWNRNENRSAEKSTDKQWRAGNKERHNDGNSDGANERGSWRQGNRESNQNENNLYRARGPRSDNKSNTNERFTKNKNDNNNWKQDKESKTPTSSSTWGGDPSTTPLEDSWGSSAPKTTTYEPNRKFRDDKFKGNRKQFENGNGSAQDGGWGKRDNVKRDKAKEGSEVSSSGSERSFRKGPRSSSRNESKEGKSFQKRSDSSFKSNNSWNISEVSVPIDAAPNTANFKQQQVAGVEGLVLVSWFHNPDHFYCQLQSAQDEFKVLMEDIQQFYKGRSAESCLPGAPIVAQFPEDNVLYRAKLLQVAVNQFTVFYVDFGNVTNVSKIWPIDNKFMVMPAQAIRSSLSGITPNEDSWPDPAQFSSFFSKEIFAARFLEQDDTRAVVELWDAQTQLADLLIEANLAKKAQSIEFMLLFNQQFRVQLKSCNSLSDISTTLDNGVTLHCKAHNLETATEQHEDVLKGYIGQTVIMFVDNVLDNTLEVTFYDNDGNKIVILAPDEGALDTVDPLCSPFVPNSRVFGFVSHADETQVFIQSSLDDVTALLDRMFESYENETNENSLVPEEGYVYAVKSEDGNWYRGRVDTFDDDKIQVTYVDYGNGEQVAFSVLRGLKSEFNVPNILALPVKVTSKHSALSLLEKDVTATIYWGEEGWEGTVETESTAEIEGTVEPEGAVETEAILETEVKGIEEKSEIAEIQEQVGEAKDEEHTDEPEKIEVKPVDETELIENETEKEPPVLQQNGSTVVVSHIDSPTQFYVQFLETASALEKMQYELQEVAEELPALTTISAGILCVAPYSVDHQWYRAEVLDADDDITTVRFIDFGNTDVINNKTTKIKTLPSNLLSLAMYATRCSLKLKPIEDEWSQAGLELFENLAYKDNLSLEFIVQDEKTNVVELYLEGVNIKDVLLKENHAIPCEIVTESSRSTCFVSHLNSPSEFWVQMENCVEELEWIAEQLSTAEQFPELQDLTPGTLCVALFQDDQMWYRARILSNTIGGIELLFIDYGNSSFGTSIRQLPEDLVMTPPLAQKCCLKKPDGIPYWTKEAQEKFAKISADGLTIFELKKITTGETAIVELLLKGENVISQILPLTEAGSIKKFLSLNEFFIEKEGVLVEESMHLEPMPNMEWGEDSSTKFLQLFPKETVFQVEFLENNYVRLYKDGIDIRCGLGGVKNNLIVLDSENSQENIEIVAEQVLSVCDEPVLHHATGCNNQETISHSKEKILTDIIQETQDNEKNDATKQVENEKFKEQESEQKDVSTAVDASEQVQPSSQNDSTQVDNEKIEGHKDISEKLDISEKVQESVILESSQSVTVEKTMSRPASRLSYDEKILPAVVSRPHSPC
ncbi:hypothetical protein ABEB36_012262 [Hypothenemus hampei]|uniref:Tudor domain-containing protein n=1 Tax=Hypothenemus hampei TaxID=57062 RepID=A0ABD1EDA9_HYPHA